VASGLGRNPGGGHAPPDHRMGVGWARGWR
jgi:hypothetical protein